MNIAILWWRWYGGTPIPRVSGDASPCLSPLYLTVGVPPEMWFSKGILVVRIYVLYAEVRVCAVPPTMEGLRKDPDEAAKNYHL